MSDDSPFAQELHVVPRVPDDPTDDSLAFIKALAAVDSHIDRAGDTLRRIHHVTSDNSANMASVATANCLLALAIMMRHAFVDDFRE